MPWTSSTKARRHFLVNPSRFLQGMDSETGKVEAPRTRPGVAVSRTASHKHTDTLLGSSESSLQVKSHAAFFRPKARNHWPLEAKPSNQATCFALFTSSL